MWAIRLAIAQAITLIAFSSWAFGGRYPGSQFYIGLIGWLGLVPLFMYWSQRGWVGIRAWLLRLSPWFVLTVQMLLSWQNPMRTSEVNQDSPYVVWNQVDPIEFLPLCFNADRTGQFIWIFIGGLITATSVFTVIRERRHIILLLMLIGINGVALALAGSWFKLTHNPLILGIFEPVNPKFFSSFRYYNHWVAFAIMSLGAAVTVADYLIQQYNKSGWNERGRQRWDLVWVAIAALIWIGVSLSGSRSGMIFAALFIMGSGLYLAFAYRRRSSIFSHLDRKARKMLGISLLAFLAIASVTGAALIWDHMLHRLELTQQNLDEGHIDQRFYASPRDCWKMVKDRPIWGWGLGSYGHVFFQYAGPEYRHPLGKIIKRNEYAHNDWMQFWVELGTIGYLCLLAVPVGIIIQTFRQPRLHAECYWLALSVGLFLTFASFDFPFGPSAGLAIFAVGFAASARLSLGPEHKPDPYQDRYAYEAD